MSDQRTDKKPRLHKHQETGLRYLLGQDKVLFETGVVIPRKLFDELKMGGLAERLEELSRIPENRGFDFPYACTTGVLRHKRGGADLVANARTERRRKKQAEAVSIVVQQQEEQKKVERQHNVFSSVFLVTAVMALVGAGSAVMSAYHTSAFLIYGGKPAWASAMTGIMLILFSGTAFTAARYFLNERGAVKLFGALFVAAGIAVIAYSMFSTLTVNFNQFKWKDDAQAAKTVETSEALAAHREQIRLIEEEVQNVAAEINRLEGEAGYWQSQSWRRYDEIIQRLNTLTEYRSTLQKQRVELVGQTPRLVEVETVSQETIYGFLAGLFKVKEEAMRFFVYVVPACLYDILAPFALSVVLLLADKKKRENRL
jgi:hypothetical protein